MSPNRFDLERRQIH